MLVVLHIVDYIRLPVGLQHGKGSGEHQLMDENSHVGSLLIIPCTVHDYESWRKGPSGNSPAPTKSLRSRRKCSPHFSAQGIALLSVVCIRD